MSVDNRLLFFILPPHFFHIVSLSAELLIFRCITKEYAM